MKFLKRFLILCLFFFLFSSNCFASDEFTTEYEIIYNVDREGLTAVLQKISLTNKLEHVYATEYKIVIGSTNLDNISAKDNFGKLEPRVKKETNTTEINLIFDKNIIGKDKTRVIEISYQTPDFAFVKGKVLEVGFPQMANAEDLKNYKVFLNIPEYFGEATGIVPLYQQMNEKGSYVQYYFEKENLVKNKGITATFGTEQILNFNLSYHLENKDKFRGRTEIALPSDTAHQYILYESIEPKPINVKVDYDGNWLAEYIVEPNSKLDIIAKGSAKVVYKARKDFEKTLSEEEIQNYTKSDVYWETSDSQVRKISQNLKSPEEIYDYIVTNFIYDYGRLSENTERMGAALALSNSNNAICMEFTDAFIALARANGIPAREHNGFAHTENDRLRPLLLDQDVLHAWPSYYDFEKKQWIEIDPTWGSTTGGLDYFNKFDLDHFTFVVHGLESTYPVTAASYKTDESQGKDVNVSFGDQFEEMKDFKFEYKLERESIAGFPYQGKVEVINTGNSALYNLPIIIQIVKNKVLWEEKEAIDVLPPFSKKEFELNFLTKWKEKGGSYKLTAKSGEIKSEFDFKVIPVTRTKVFYYSLAGLGGLVLLICLIVVINKKIRKKKAEKQKEAEVFEKDILRNNKSDFIDKSKNKV